MTITLREFVGREIIYCVSSLVSDLSTLMQSCPSRELIDYDWEEDILPLLEWTDWEEAATQHINDMDRAQLLEALDDASVEDERNQHQIAEVVNHHAMENGLDIEDWHTWWEDFMGMSEDDLRTKLTDHLEDSHDDAWKDFCQQYDVDIDDYRHEVYEHWIITDWLAGKLRAHGHVVGELMGLTIWGRPTTGQSISMDGVIQSIYKEMTGNDVTSADY